LHSHQGHSAFQQFLKIGNCWKAECPLFFQTEDDGFTTLKGRGSGITCRYNLAGLPWMPVRRECGD
jgi:hypothetical protein